MSIRFKKIRDYLLEQAPDYGDNAQSLLEMLYHRYKEENPTENAEIYKKFAEVDTILSKLTLRENDKLFFLICELIEVFEYRAFFDGLQIGVRLCTELITQTKA